MGQENTGMRLLRKGQSGLRQLLLGRMTVVLLLLILQIFVLIALFAWFEEYCIHYFGGSALIGFWMVIWLLNREKEPTVRTSWVIIIMSAPVFGSLLYLFTNKELGNRLLRRRIKQTVYDSVASQNQNILEELKTQNSGAASLCNYLHHSGSVVYANTKTTYLPSGERMLEAMLRQLESAKRYIYLEYFIIGEGTMWGRVLDILAKKAAEGLDVRVLYDGTCEFILLPKGYPARLAKLGIKAKVFAPFSAFVSTYYNYRDHRKIAVIDGNVAFTGGINLSDEYINIGCRFGHWKDSAVLLEGDAAEGFERLFLQMWNMDERRQDLKLQNSPVQNKEGHGFIVPFGDYPLDSAKTGQTLYMDMINRAVSCVRIMTPYLIIDEQMEQCLCNAAIRGVRVELILPGIADKYVPYALAKTHYRTLLYAGVRIYEYIPGFVHSKVVAADDREAVVGTVNFDYRSFLHHFECGAYMYEADCIGQILEDFDSTIEQCRSIGLNELRKEKWHRRLTGFLLKGFAPLL